MSGTRLRILRAVRSYQGRNAASWAAVVTIGRAAGLSERAARYQLRALVRDGYLSRKDVFGKTSLFTVTPSGEGALAAAVDHGTTTPPLFVRGATPPTPPLFAPEIDHSDHTRAGARIPEPGSARTQRAAAVAASMVSASLSQRGAGALVFEPGVGWWIREGREGGVVLPLHAPPAPPAETTPATPATPSSPPSQPSPVTTPFLEAEETTAPSSTPIPDADEEAEEPAAAQARWARAEPASGGSGAAPPSVIRSTTDQLRITRARAIPGNQGNVGRIPARSSAPFEPNVYEVDIARALSLAGFPELVPPPGALASDARASFVERLSRIVGPNHHSLDRVIYTIGRAGHARAKAPKNPVQYTLLSTGRVVVLPHPWGFNTANADELDAMRAKLYRWCEAERRHSIPASALRWFNEPEALSAPAGEPESPPASSARPAPRATPSAARRPAPTSRPGLRRAAPLPPASPEPQPGDDAHLAAVRAAIFTYDPVFERAPLVSQVADERFLAFLAGIAREKLSPEETRFEVYNAATMIDDLDKCNERTSSKTEKRERLVDAVRKIASGCRAMWQKQWRERKAWLRAQRKRERAEGQVA